MDVDPPAAPAGGGSGGRPRRPADPALVSQARQEKEGRGKSRVLLRGYKKAKGSIACDFFLGFCGVGGLGGGGGRQGFEFVTFFGFSGKGTGGSVCIICSINSAFLLPMEKGCAFFSRCKKKRGLKTFRPELPCVRGLKQSPRK